MSSLKRKRVDFKRTVKRQRTRQQATVVATVDRRIANREETKAFVTSLNASASTTVSLTKLSSIPVGTGQEERIGDVVMVKSMSSQFTSIVADATNFVRIIIFQWFEDDAVDPPTPAMILTSPTLIASNYEYNSRRKRKILWDKTLSLSLNGGPANAHVKKRISFFPKEKIYYSPTGAITGKNNIWMLKYSDSGAVVHPTFKFMSMLQYTDA